MATQARPTALTKGQATFIRLVQAGTGLSFRVIYTWVKAEGGPDDNPLNIGPGNHYGSPTRAALATIALLRSPQGRKYGYDKILANARNDKAALQAIADSSWDAGHYGGGKLLADTYSYYFPDASVKSGISDWAKGVVTDPGQALADAGDWWGGKLGFLGVLFDPKTWIRVLLVIVGAIIAIWAINLFSRQLGGTRGNAATV